ncbi:MAG: sirohydrochlorin chelatase [Nitrospina sp.]|jgi:precorrin-8X/cobalt-precorrin-8 methylmutase|nr:sirohydrochlorin chelatase [Nitrospina sp.]MBT3511344.1 sirohydrochlorin chelatase [Nitrospina sp.]MBT3875138.1 sirohydrochlorin chelatase [Nitrospina sp.]MBT4047432.1 sirohydrochlorin chelatase [Nitrospina sp.]MBT4556001.1 sirohydrochlorin chelatase [Nitrospina sp.]
MGNITDDRLPETYAICLLGHGSRDPEGIQEFLTLWQKLHERKICQTTKYGFLEFAQPTVLEALSNCHGNGIKNIIILPNILLHGEHTQKDIPDAVSKVSQDHPEINILYAEPLGTQPEVMEVCKDRIEQAENISQKTLPRSATMLMTVAHGSHDSSSNSQVEKCFRLFGQKLGFCKTVTHFAGSSQYSLEDTLEKLNPQNFQRVILLPFFLFTGVWVKRIHALADTFQRKHPDTEFLKASCLKHHELIVETLIQQARKSITSGRS